MLFNSYVFILLFLPVTLVVYYRLGRRVDSTAAFYWLILVSLLFYGFWNIYYPLLLLGSVGFNFLIGRRLLDKESAVSTARKWYLFVGVAGNIIVLGYCKYANFFIENLNHFLKLDVASLPLVLPLAVSFFTFQQIAYLVDTYHHKTESVSFLHYLLFVSFFPKLTAGPIVTYAEMFPGLKKTNVARFTAENPVVGVTIFSLGLFKKVILAEQAAKYANPVFAANFNGIECSFFEAWMGIVAYNFQIYFDFSGYSDMAIGLARMFGFRLPENFNSPYKASSVIDFWRRWHISLSNFLKNYIYIPLGGNRRGAPRRYINLLLTMLLAGLWHGAGWPFILWGGLHGLFLVINHLWRKWQGWGHAAVVAIINYGARLWTLGAVTIAWVFFRAEDMTSALRFLKALVGGHGFSLPYKFGEKMGNWEGTKNFLAQLGVNFSSYNELLESGQLVVLFLFFALTLGPNVQQIMVYCAPCQKMTAPSPRGFSSRIVWRPNGVCFALMLVICLSSFVCLYNASEFVYFRF